MTSEPEQDQQDNVIWVLPWKSQDFMEGPKTELTPSALTISYDGETDEGNYEWAKLEFSGVAAFEFTTSALCSAEQVRAYDKVVKVQNSDWLRQRQSERPFIDGKELTHFRIYFDEIGCFEVLSVNFTSPT